ncbi:MAG: outer membrane protein assembly factor BamE [Gammaproteobacteria bacterium]|nr:outer membrane protein assembly factor BamE [Gammaproteobacteria bacterium]
MPKTMIFLLFVLLISTVTINGCTVHRLDIQQGNIIKDEMVDQLKIGNSKRQVRFVMGSPLLTDPFHANRWDYIYTDQPGDERKVTERRQLTVYFENDRLVKIVK